MKRRTLSLLLCLCLLLCLLPAAAFAEEMPICPNCGTNEMVERLPGYGYDFFSDPDVGHYPHYMCNFSGKHNTGGPKGFDGPALPHRFVDGVCQDCEYECRHNYTSTIGDGVYWLTCSKCNYVDEKDFPVFNLNAPDKVCRTQDCVISFTVPDGSTEPGYNWEFSLKGDGAELTPENGVCTATIKADWYVDGENRFKVQVGAYVDGIYFYQSKYITIVDEHTGGTATCADKAICEICSEPYGTIDRANHTGGTQLKGEKSATCTENGYTGDTYCLGCNAVLEEGTVIPAEGHKGGTATCAEKAVCEVCSEPYGTIDRANHTGGTQLKGEKSATCTEDGYTGDTYCLGCNAVLEEGAVIPAEGHKGGTATCADKATCDVCNEPYGTIDRANHAGGTEVRGAKPATDTEDGYTGDTYCLGCGELLALGEVIPAEKPVVPSEEPVIPSEEPVLPSEEPVLPSEEPAAPSEKPADNTDAPKTGDSSSVTLWFALLLFSGAAIVKTVKFPKKKEK